MDEHLIEIDQMGTSCLSSLRFDCSSWVARLRKRERGPDPRSDTALWSRVSARSRRLRRAKSRGPRARTRPDDGRPHHPTPTTQPLKPTSPYSRDQLR
jgi:hypothetical protein